MIKLLEQKTAQFLRSADLFIPPVLATTFVQVYRVAWFPHSYINTKLILGDIGED